MERLRLIDYEGGKEAPQEAPKFLACRNNWMVDPFTVQGNPGDPEMGQKITGLIFQA